MAEREKEGVERRLPSKVGMKASTDAFYPRSSSRIDSIEASIKSDMVASNINRVAILHVLKNSPKKEMQAEKLAQILGVSHRTVLYHLDILENYELVEVRGFRKKGRKMLRSVWGLNTDVQTKKVFGNISKRIPPEKIRKSIKAKFYAR